MPQIDLRNWGKGRPDTPAAPTSTPTKEQFEAAAQRVMQTAPPGLSREDFFNLIDRELAPHVSPQFANAPVDETGKVSEPEPTTRLGGFLKSIKDQVLHATVDNPALQGAAHPQTTGDMLSLALPSGLPNMRVALRNVAREVGAGVSEAPTLRKVPGSVISHVSDYLNEAPETTNTRLFNQKPLYEQMKDLPGLAAPEARAAIPIRPPQGTFNDLPLYKQMEELTKNPLPAPELSRGAAPPLRRVGMETPAVESPFDHYLPNSSGYKPGDVGEAALPIEHSLVDHNMPNVGGVPDRGVPQNLPSGRPVMERFAPNRSGYRNAATDVSMPTGELPTSDSTLIDRYAPSRSGYKPGDVGEAPQLLSPSRQPVTPLTPRLNKSALPPLKQSLEDLIAEMMNPESPTKYTGGGMELPPQLETAGEGALKQSGKFGKSGNLGQAGGYTSGRPGITEAQQDELLGKFGGGGGGPEPPTRPPGGDVITPPSSKIDVGPGDWQSSEDWHSGAEPGSVDAAMAHTLHPETRGLDNLYHSRINDPLAALLMSLGIGAGAYGAHK